jgi:hypothetical protein
MRISARICSQVCAVLVFSCVFNPTFGAVFAVGPGSTFTLDGSFSLSGLGASGFAMFEEQGGAGSGSLSTTLGGTIEASVVGSTLNFTGGTITANNSGTWQPRGMPAAFGFQSTLVLGGSLSGFTLQLTGDVQDVMFNVTGSTALSGPPSNQTFDTDGLALNATGGTLALHGNLCGPTGCTEIPTTSDTIAGPPADILPPATGHLTRTATTQTLSFPFSFSDTDSETDQGITITATLSGSGSIVAVTAIPEPEAWLLLLIGLIGIVAERSRQHRR